MTFHNYYKMDKEIAHFLCAVGNRNKIKWLEKMTAKQRHYIPFGFFFFLN